MKICTLLLLPGLDGTGRLLADFSVALPANIAPRIVAYPPNQPWGYSELEDFVRREFPAEGEFALLGESFSGPLALRLARQHPPGLKAVVLAASFVRNPVNWAPRWLRWGVGSWMFRLPPSRFLLRRYLVGSDAPPILLEQLVPILKSVSPRVVAARIREVMCVDASGDLRECPVPVMYLGASRDRLVSLRAIDELRALRPDLQITMLEAPHLLLERFPGVAAEAVGDFLGRFIRDG